MALPLFIAQRVIWIQGRQDQIVTIARSGTNKEGTHMPNDERNTWITTVEGERHYVPLNYIHPLPNGQL